MPRPGVTLLTEVGKLARRVSADEVARWQRQLRSGALTRKQAARLHLWLGEIKIARDRDPDAAQWHFAQAQRLARRADPVYGCAAYDHALVLFFEGAYALSAPAFHDLLQPKPVLYGYSRRNCALWFRHAAACAGYHAQHAKLGITEPSRLDPLCGVAALAACMREHGRPYDRKTLMAHCDATGLGIGIGNLRTDAIKLGMSARIVKADEEGLLALPKPLVAYVEQDHFVAVTRADKDGVSYLCSDCGAWPGGRRDLTWKQWKAMDCNLYLVVTKPGSPEDVALRALRSPTQAPAPEEQARNGNLIAYRESGRAASGKWAKLLLGRHVVLYVGTIINCVRQPTSTKETPNTNCPTDSPGGSAPGTTPTPKGPTCGDPVNLATGEEEYHPEPDLVVYNPIGPAVVWQREYGSLRGPFLTPSGLYPYAQSTLGYGWNTNYDLQVIVSADTTQASLNMPNGGSFLFNVPFVPTAGNPQAVCTAATNSVPMLCSWNYNSDGSLSFTFTQTDHSQWVFSSLNGYALTRMVDRNGNFINFVYNTPGSNPGYQLSAITDSNGVPLLTLQHNSNFNLTAAVDRYHRAVYYQAKQFPNFGISVPFADELTQVSQVVRQGTQVRPIRFQYGYEANTTGEGTGQIPVLHTITVPSPTGRGVSTATINYNGVYVGSITDANGNTTTYTQVDYSDTRVTITDPRGKVAYSYTVNFDAQMRTISRTDGTNQTLVYQAAYFADNPYQPQSVTDGNNHTTSYTYDPYGQVQTVTSPRNVVTTYTRDYSAFPLGELTQIQEGTKSPITLTHYEPSGLIKTITTPMPGTAGSTQTAATTFTYDVLGNVLTVARPGNDTTSTITTTFNYTQDGAYRQADAIGQPLTVTDNLGNVSHFRYDAESNRTTVVDALGNRYDWQYNLANQPIATLSPAVGDLSSQIGVSRSSLSYQSSTKTYTGTLTLTNNGSQAIQGYLFAALTNLAPGVKLTNAAGTYVNSPALLSGQVSLAPGASTILNVSFSAPSANAVNYGVQTYLTDGNGNPIAVRPTMQSLYLYPGGLLTGVAAYDETGALVRKVGYQYGREGELLSISGSTEPATFAYDAAYRRISLADGNGNKTAWAYNTAGWPASITYPKKDQVQFTSYDPTGNPLVRIDGRGIETDYTYNDPESHLTNIQYVNSAKYPNVSQNNITVDYDGYGRIGDIYHISGHTHLEYDDLDTTTTIATAYSDANGNALPTVTLDYGFNADGSRHTMNVQTATTSYGFAYGYDAAGRPKSVTNPFNETTQWTYLNNGWLQSQQEANGVTALYAYNRRGFLNDLTHYAANGAALSDFGTMTYDAVANQLTKAVTIPGAPASYSGHTAYAYDGKDQLKQEQSSLLGSFTSNFNYDPAANPLSFKGQSHGFNADNQFTDSGFTYDGEGNPTTYAGQTLTFDPEDRMTSYGNVLTAGYRTDGLRAWKQTANGRTYFIYDGIMPVCELNEVGAVSAVNTFGANGLISRQTNAGSVFYAFDPQGSVSQRRDATGNLLTTSNFDAFGTATSTASSTDPFGYGGQLGYVTDPETGLLLLGHRYYDAVSGRFLNRDPIGTAGGVNVYTYVVNNPTNLMDPIGAFSFFNSPFAKWIRQRVMTHWICFLLRICHFDPDDVEEWSPEDEKTKYEEEAPEKYGWPGDFFDGPSNSSKKPCAKGSNGGSNDPTASPVPPVPLSMPPVPVPVLVPSAPVLVPSPVSIW
jgi:RHS repeat-associated protein